MLTAHLEEDQALSDEVFLGYIIDEDEQVDIAAAISLLSGMSNAARLLLGLLARTTGRTELELLQEVARLSEMFGDD